MSRNGHDEARSPKHTKNEFLKNRINFLFFPRYLIAATGSGLPDPPPPTCSNGAVAQLVERLLCKQDVVGSTPSGSTIPRLVA